MSKPKYKFIVHTEVLKKEVITVVKADEMASSPTGVIYYNVTSKSLTDSTGKKQPQEIELKHHVSQVTYLYTEVERNV